MILDLRYMGCNNMNNMKDGFSLVEIAVYVALLGMAAVFMVNSFIQMSAVYARARAEREVLTNARAVLTAITDAIASSQAVYGPTSRFNTDAGQLSLATNVTSTPPEKNMFVDFWVDGGRIFERREGRGAVALSAGTARVSMLRFERIAQALGREAVKATIRVDATATRFPASVTLNASTALRGNY